MPDDPTKSMPVGLAENPKGIQFRCGQCKFFLDGKCWNKNPRLEGKPVGEYWCCNLFRHTGMRVVIR